MSDTIIENPILNSPYFEPERHFKFTDEGITNEIVEGRRSSSYFVPIARPKKKGIPLLQRVQPAACAAFLTLDRRQRQRQDRDAGCSRGCRRFLPSGCSGCDFATYHQGRDPSR
jgi:hypothetical protein